MIGYDAQRPTDAPLRKRCPVCGGMTDWDTMIWLEGRCTCPACYEKIRAALDRAAYEREGGNEND